MSSEIEQSLPKSSFTAEALEARVREYMQACTDGDAAKIADHLSTDAVHYFPPDMYDGPWCGAEFIADRWADAVRKGGSAWTVDKIVVDVERQEAVSEWTHFKTVADVILRGAEWYEFDEEGKISEIRAYYASPQDKTLPRLALGGFDYSGRGYASQWPLLNHDGAGDRHDL